MVNAQRILTEINRLLVTRFPENTVYVDLCPADFERPSFFIECGKITQAAASRACIRETDEFIVTYLPPVDAYGYADGETLMQMQGQLLDLFRSGFLRVEDRAIGVSVSGTGGDMDYTSVNCRAEYFEDRWDEIEIIPMMETIETGVHLT